MEKFDLSNKASDEIRLDHNNDPQAVLLEGVAENATINVDVTFDKSPRNETITTIGVAQFLEATKKIGYLNTGRLTPFGLMTKTVGADTIVCVNTAFLPLSIGGEIKLGHDDYIDVYLEDLESVPDASMRVVGGKQASNQFYNILTSEFEYKEREKPLDLSKVDYLILDRTTLPYELEIMYGSERKLLDADYLLAQQKEMFGTVAISSKNVPILGTYKVIVVDLRDATSAVLRAEKNATGKLDYFTVKL